MNRIFPPLPLIFLALLLTCGGLLGFGYYMQYARGLEPCPLCIFQRLAYLGVAACALLGLIWRGPIGERVALVGAGVCALGGAAIAGRQIWLQFLPPEQIPECGPGLDFMLETFPLSETLRMVLTGSGECAKVDWTFLALSIAEWSLFWFVALLALSVVCLLRHPAIQNR